MAYVTISGLPYVWSNREIPSEWEVAPGSDTVVIGGETYAWQRTLITDSAFATIAQSVNATGGVGITGDHTFRFTVAGDIDSADDVWLGLAYANSIASSAEVVTRALETLTPDETADYEVQDASGFDASGLVHAATEAISYASKTTGGAESLDTLTRGAYESQPLHHLGGDDMAEWGALGGAPFVSTHAVAWQGRTVRLWLAPGRLDSGSFVPKSSAIRGTEDLEAFGGISDRIRPAAGGTIVEVTAFGLLHLLVGELATRLPRAIAGLPDGRRVQIAEDNRTLHWTWTFLAQSVVSNVVHVNAEDLVVGSSPVAQANGLYPMAEINRTIQDTLRNGANPSTLTSLTYWLSLNDNKAVLEFSAPPSSAGQLWSLTINASIGDSFWRELGFEGIIQVEPVTVGARSVWIFEAQKALPTFRLPAGDLTRRIHYHTPTGPDLQVTTWKDAADNTIDGAVSVGDKEVVTFASLGTEEGFNYLQISERAKYGSFSDEEIYIEWNPNTGKQKSMELVQGIGFDGLGDFRAALNLLLGGSGVDGFNDATYDKGWRGSGAFIDADLIDIDSFEELDDLTQPPKGRDNRFISSPTDLRAWLHAMMIESQAFPLATWSSSDGRFKLRARQAKPVRESDRADAHVIDRSVTWTGGPDKIDVEIDQGMLVNAATVRVGLNNADGKWTQELQSTASNSIGTWGRKDRFDFEIGSISDPIVANMEAIDLLGSIYRSLAIPYAILSIPIADPESWGWQLFDAVVVTHPSVPKRLSSGRGITDVLGTIVGKTDIYRGAVTEAIRSMLRVLIVDYGGSRWSTYAPSCRGTVVGGQRVEDIEDHAFSRLTGPLDASHFAEVDFACRIYKRGDESTAVERQVTAFNLASSDLSWLEFNSAFGLTGEVVVEFVGYIVSTIQDGQRVRVFMSNADGKLDKSAGTPDLAYKYS